MLAILLAAGVLLAGCGDGKSTVQTGAKTPESTPTEEPTAEPEEEAEVTDEAEQQDEPEIDLPDEEEMIADYTSAEGLPLEEGTCFAVVAKNTGSGYWDAVKEGISQAIDDLNETLGYEGDDKITFTFEGTKDETDVDSQVNTLEAVLTEATLSGKPYVLCLAAIDMNSCEALLEGADGSGIPVIVLDSGVNSDLVETSCVTDNYAAGREAAKRLCQEIGDAGRIAVAAHMSLSESSQKRVRGFTDEIAENHPEVSVVEISYEPEAEEDLSIQEQMESVLTQYPDLKGYFCTNESMSTQALAVLKDYEDRGIVLVGFDMGKTQMQAIRDGQEAGVVTQNPYGMGYATVVAGARAILGMENEEEIDPGFQWIDQENIDLEENQKYIYE